MALGAITKVTDYVAGNKKVHVRDIVLSTGANWTTAGETLTPAQVGLTVVEHCGPGLATNGTLSFQVMYDITNQKLIAFAQNSTSGAAVGQPKVTGNTDLSGYTVRLTFTGRR
jgi:hypothetical protein